jgi:hypothetical protein
MSIALVALAACGGPSAPAPSKPPTDIGGPSAGASIGQATMEADGTIVLMLRAEDGHGAVGDGMVRYPPSDKDYADVLKHLGGLERGEVKPVPPWP